MKRGSSDPSDQVYRLLEERIMLKKKIYHLQHTELQEMAKEMLSSFVFDDDTVKTVVNHIKEEFENMTLQELIDDESDFLLEYMTCHKEPLLFIKQSNWKKLFIR